MTHDPNATQQPRTEPGQDSRVEDWFGQSVQRDAELADEVVASDDGDMEQAEADFDARSTGSDEQARRHGDHIDPDQGRSAYQTSEDDPDSPGATIDDDKPAEPNEPG
jgi:hypothetical protein